MLGKKNKPILKSIRPKLAIISPKILQKVTKNIGSGTEEDHRKFCRLRSDFKKIMNDKMRLNVVDDTDPGNM